MEEISNGVARTWKGRKEADKKEKEAKKEVAAEHRSIVTRAAMPRKRAGIPDVLKKARYENITRLILQGNVKPKTLAVAVGLKPAQLQRILREPSFIEIFDRASEALLANVDDIIRDETASLSIRKNALHRRSVTLIGKVLETVDAEIEHAKDMGTPWAVRATMVKAGIEAATGAIDRDTTTLEPQHGTSKHLHLHITQHDADVLRDTMQDVAEEVNISDVFSDGKVIEAEVVEAEEDS